MQLPYFQNCVYFVGQISYEWVNIVNKYKLMLKKFKETNSLVTKWANGNVVSIYIIIIFHE